MFKIKMRARQLRWTIGKYFYFSFNSKSKRIKTSFSEKATVILLSYNRPKNIPPMVKHILNCDFVEKIIVSNNNPDVSIEDFITDTDKRVFLINQPEKTQCRYRWSIARQHPSDYYIVIDDDLFIYPAQLSKLFQYLIEEPDNPHGLFGTEYDKKAFNSSNSFGYYVRGQSLSSVSQPIDVLHQIYAVSKTHVDRYFDCMDFIKTENPKIYDYLNHFGDDIIISFTAENKPVVHNIGFIYECITSNRRGFSQNTCDEFAVYRKEIFSMMKTLKSSNQN